MILVVSGCNDFGDFNFEFPEHFSFVHLRAVHHCSDSRIGGQGAQALPAYLLFSSMTVVQIDGSLILDADFVPGQQQQQQQGAVDASAGKSAFAALLHDAEEEEEEDEEEDDNRCSFFIVRR